MDAGERVDVTAEQLAEHLSWRLSNSNGEIELDNGKVLDIAFNAWNEDVHGPTFELYVGTGAPAFQRFLVVLAPMPVKTGDQ